MEEWTKELKENYVGAFKKYVKTNLKGRIGKQKKDAVENSFTSSIDNKKTYKSFAFTNNKLDKFIMAFKGADLDGPLIVVSHIYYASPPSKEELANEIKEMKSFFKGKLAISFALTPDQEEIGTLLRGMKFKLASTELMGRVEESFKKVSRFKTEFFVEKLNVKKDLVQVMKLQELAHRRDKSSRIRLNTPAIKKKMRDHIKAMAKIESFFVLKDGTKVIGLVGTYPDKDIALLGTISVHPNYQGLGLSKVLYRTALADLKRRRCRYFKGHTTTSRVVAQSKKMKRWPSMVIYRK